MTDQEINDVIAVACGWKMTCEEAANWKSNDKWVTRPDGCSAMRHDIPSYTTDLNPIADAIKGLRNRERARFNQWFLTKYEASIEDADPDEMPGLYLCNLNARELCEAFLYAHNLWMGK